jgi:hypothetical protein
MEGMLPTFALLWSPWDAHGTRGYLRGIRPDGSYYGEVLWLEQDPDRRQLVNVHGQIGDDVWPRCQHILEQIGLGPAIEPSPSWIARLARWRTSLSDAEIVAGYAPGDEVKLEPARLFLELLTLLESAIAKSQPGDP